MINDYQVGAFRGRKLIQRRGEVGGAKSVFVKLQGIKNELVYPSIGGLIKNPFKGTAKLFAGDLCEYRTNDKGVKPEVYILKTYLVESVSGTTVNVVRDGYKHIPFVGDSLGVAPEEIGGEMTAVTVTAVAKAKVGDVDVWALTVSGTLDASNGDVLVEADSDGNMMVKAINGVVDADCDMLDAPATGDEDFDGARYMYTPALGGIMYAHKMSPMPACVLALNKCDIHGWFKVDGLAAPEAEVDALNAEIALLNQNGATVPTTSTKGVVGSTYTVTVSGSEALYICTAVGSGDTPTYTWIKMFPNA